MVRRLGATSICLACAVAALFGQSYTDAQLYNEGRLAWDRGSCVRASRFFFAYLVRNPGVQNRNEGTLMQKAIDWCESNSTVAVPGSKGDDPGDGGVRPLARPPRPVLALPGSPIVAAPEQRRCDSYARIAVAQAQIYLANSCGAADTRWDTTYANHFNWCSAVGAAQSRAETAARQQILETSCAP